MAKKNFLKKGLFITFEGPEGSGKSTHAKDAFNFLKRKGFNCVFTREPGGTLIGDKIRKILLGRKNRGLNDLAELFLFEAARAQIVEEVILPALKKGKIVICDRFGDATVVYQGFAAGLDIGFIKKLNNFATRGVKPHLTILMDIETKKGLKRALKNRKADRLEAKSIAFHRKVRGGYLKLARRERGRIKVVKTNKPLKDARKKVRGIIIKCLSKI